MDKSEPEETKSLAQKIDGKLLASSIQDELKVRVEQMSRKDPLQYYSPKS